MKCVGCVQSEVRGFYRSPIPISVARKLVEQNHYLRSLPGGTQLALGVFFAGRLSGVITFGAGSYNSPSLADGATAGDCLTLTRLWLSDDLPKNSESRVLGIALKTLAKNTSLKFVVTYADPAVGHLGVIYQATNWLYVGLSKSTAYYDLGDGKLAHCLTVSGSHGSRSMKYLNDQGVFPKITFQPPKHRYVYFLDPTWRPRLKVPVLPKPESTEGRPWGQPLKKLEGAPVNLG